MATCPDARFRDAARAVRAAERSIELDGGEDYLYLDTLAAAFASAGRFDEAKSTLATALAMAPEPKRPPMVKRLELYQQGNPYRDTRN